MRDTRIIAICLLFLTLIIFSCKKESHFIGGSIPNEAIEFNCGRPKFIDTLTVNFGSTTKINATISGANNIYISSVGSTTLNILKVNCDAAFLWQKNYSFPGEKVISVNARENGDNFYVLTASDNFTINAVDTLKAWVCEGVNLQKDSVSCSRTSLAYSFIPNYITGTRVTLSNYSKIYKYDSNGNLVWQKILPGNYYENKGISIGSNNAVYVLTASRKSYNSYMEPSMQGVYPAYLAPLDSNSFAIYKFDSLGNQLASATIDKVFSFGSNYFNLQISVTASNVNVICDRVVYCFDSNLGNIGSFSPFNPFCDGKNVVPLENPKLSESVFNIKVIDGLNVNYYREHYNATSKVLSYNYGSSACLYTESAIDDKKNIYFVRPDCISKYDNLGGLKYNKTLSFPPVYITDLATVEDQIYYFYYNTLGQLYIIKTDINGNY